MKFPNYGHMPAEWKAGADLDRPARFANADGTPASAAQWIAWVDAMADDLASFLWPRFVSGGWQGKAKSHMETLTREDLRLMGPMFDLLDQSPPGVTPKHDAFFTIEDARPPNAAGFLHYAPLVPRRWLLHFDRLLLEGGRELAHPVSINLKRRMQRPRAYQSAMMLAPGDAFRYRAASSATSAAMVSGHCLQGVMALVNVVLGLEDLAGAPLDPPLLGLMQQYFIDTGDRRVFAGVHYPTDNLSSWYVALHLCCHVFETDEKKARAREVLWDAISHKSTVYLALERAVAGDAASPFAGPLSHLKEQAARPCRLSSPAPTPITPNPPTRRSSPKGKTAKTA